MEKDRRAYMKEYRRDYGDTMREQVKGWFKEHPDYLNNYCKNWRAKNQLSYNRYMRGYMSVYRLKRIKEAGLIREGKRTLAYKESC